jgi:hypothetical protein
LNFFVEYVFLIQERILFFFVFLFELCLMELFEVFGVFCEMVFKVLESIYVTLDCGLELFSFAVIFMVAFVILVM